MTSMMKSPWRLVLLGLFSFGSLCRAEGKIYLAPNGNDAWSGTLAEPNADRTDGPVATPARARDLARAAHGADGKQPVEVILRGGTYLLSEPLVLGPEDSHTTWSAFRKRADTPRETPILSGGRRLTHGTVVSLNGHHAWRFDAAVDGKLDFRFHELWLNDKSMPRARWPKKGTLAVGQTPKTKTHAEWREPEDAFPFNAGEVPTHWQRLGDVEVLLTSRWVDARMPLVSIDDQAHEIHCARKATFHAETGDRFALENVQDVMTEPGEWCLNSADKAVYLLPPAALADASPDSVDVMVPSLAQLVRLCGNIAQKRWISDVNFIGITFSHNEWFFDHVAPGQRPDAARTGFPQAAAGVPGAVWGEGVRHATFDGCHFAHLASYGLELARASRDNQILSCTFTDLGAGAIVLGERAIRDDLDDQNSHNRVIATEITDGGNLFPGAVGILIGQSHDNLVCRNRIAHFWYSGISVGWTWGYGRSLSQNNVIQFNDVGHIGAKNDGDEPILSDMGAIYTLGNQDGSKILQNRFHDIAGVKYGGWGIYFDEGTTGIVAEQNVVYRTTHGGFHQHYGKDNIVRNNLFALARDGQIQRTKVEDHTSFIFENNLVYWTQGKLFTGKWNPLNARLDNNAYWYGGESQPRFAGRTFPQWQATGADAHSLVGKPHFINGGDDNFRLAADAGPWLAGFHPEGVPLENDQRDASDAAVR